MNEIEVSINGTICSEVSTRTTNAGVDMTSFRVATSERLLREGRWEDGPTVFLGVTCFRSLARNVAASARKGDAVIVRGRLRIREWEGQNGKGTSVEIDATTVGFDLTKGMAAFTRVKRTEAGETSSDPESSKPRDPWEGIDPALAVPGRAAGLTPDRVQADASAAAA